MLSRLRGGFSIFVELNRHLLETKMGNIRAIGSLFHRHRTDVATNVDIQDCILIQASCLSDLGSSKLDVQRIGILKVLNFHGLNVRSKNTCGLFLHHLAGQHAGTGYPFHQLGPATNATILLGHFPDRVLDNVPNVQPGDRGIFRRCELPSAASPDPSLPASP